MGKTVRSYPAGDGTCALSEGEASSRRAAQAVDALRHGWPIRVDGGPVLLPVETGLAPGAIASVMLISAARAATLKLTNQRDAAIPHAPVLIRADETFDLARGLPIADPALDLAHPLKGPFRVLPLEWQDGAAGAMKLARIAGILPAFLVNPEPAGLVQDVSTAGIAALTSPASLVIATHADLPISADENGHIYAFRTVDDTREHIALVIGQRTAGKVPLVRLHSECLTGDILGSLKCDCGPQLDSALAAMSAEAQAGGWGILLYMRQEGRGIGLINKLRAYRLQDQGFDTIEANQRLGLPDEARDFPVAARMLALLDVPAIRLMTNNPAKVVALETAGVTITDRVPHQLPDNPHNRRYLTTKRDRAGHLLR
ncbi:MAG: GTP cyclohydrolase II [Sphingomonadaceae bacterium]